MGVPGNFERGVALADIHPDTDANPPGDEPDEDRKKLLPDQPGPRGAQGSDEQRDTRRDETAVGKDRDPSSYGGPLNLDDRGAV